MSDWRADGRRYGQLQIMKNKWRIPIDAPFFTTELMVKTGFSTASTVDTRKQAQVRSGSKHSLKTWQREPSGQHANNRTDHGAHVTGNE